MFHFANQYLFLFVVAISLVCTTSSSFVLNQTGGSFPNSVYLQTTFSYNFVAPSVSTSYFGPSSSVGKCNIMGYWHTLNTAAQEESVPLSTKKFDQAVCTDKCTVTTCGYAPRTNGTINLTGVIYTKLTVRRGASTRVPLVDIGASDGLLGAADYLNFPDLQMLPAVAGAVVPIYNIPDLLHANITAPIVLSRSSLVNIFMGRIQTWNDPSIVADNVGNPQVSLLLSTLSQMISIVVRTDSSGTSEVFTAALDAISPAGFAVTPTGLVADTDGSFHDQVTPTGPSPSPRWCGPSTDELQFITLVGCNPSSPSKALLFKMVDATFILRNVTFDCDSSANTIRSVILSAAALDVHVTLTDLTVAQGAKTVQIEIGYKGLKQQGKNWFNPIVLSTPPGVTASIKARQEGGYLNTVTTCTGLPSTSQTQSVWILAASSTQFVLSWTANGAMLSTISFNYAGADISAKILQAVNSVTIGAVTSVTQILHGTWTEFRMVFASSTHGTFSSLNAVPLGGMGSIYVATFLDYNNYPCFYDSANPRGYASSGRYTCYMRQLNFNARSYYTGNSNPGVVAEVISRPYSIGYSVLEIALAQNLPTASMINKAGSTIVASSESVAFAIMDQGGNLNSLFQANLADGSSSSVWPISGFTYFIIRNNHHISAGNCPRRSAAMEYLYNFYTSPAVAASVQKLGFAALPQFVASIILNQLVNYAKCDNGQYALAKYRISPTPLIVPTGFQRTISEYLSAYAAVDPSAVWHPTYNDESAQIWVKYTNNPSAASGALTMFSSRAEKIQRYNRSDILTTAFANVAVVPLYHLNAYTVANAVTGNSGTNPTLRVTRDIISGILLGSISHWNDSLIQAANSATRSFLPYLPIMVVVRPLPCDTNALMLRFLNESSPRFRALLAASGGSKVTLDFSSLIPPSRLVNAVTNDRVDSLISTFDGSFGYYLQNNPPISTVAAYCADPTCATGIVDPSDVQFITACESDTATVLNPTSNLFTYDLMSSTAAQCYPIVGTVDYSVLTTTDSTCSLSGSASSTVLKDRIRFGSWLFSSSVIVQPLASISIGATPLSLRQSTFKQICDITCNDVAYGYSYCGYRDCSYVAGDFKQIVSECDPVTEKRTVTFEFTRGANAACIQNPRTMPPSSIMIGCSDVLTSYGFGKISVALSIIGMIVCVAVFLFVFANRTEKIIKKSQPIFIYIFITGGFLMNLSILAFLGPNNDRNCLLRPWALDISTTIMFAPLLMKLHRIDILFRSSKKLKKTKIQSYTVALQVLALVCVDITILILWTVVARPIGLTYGSTAGGLYEPVMFTVCSTNLNSPFEQAMVAWKAMLLAAGVYKSICTWDMPSDIAEVKHFFLAIYNVSVVGGAMYFFSLYGASSAGSFVILRCVGIFVSATLPVLIIMVPKFTVIQYKQITGKNLWAASKNFADKIGSNSRSKESYGEINSYATKEVADRLQQNQSAKVVPTVTITATATAAEGEGETEEKDGEMVGVGSAKSYFSGCSKVQPNSCRIADSSFKFADRVANDKMNMHLDLYRDKDEEDRNISVMDLGSSTPCQKELHQD